MTKKKHFKVFYEVEGMRGVNVEGCDQSVWLYRSRYMIRQAYAAAYPMRKILKITEYEE